MYTAFFAEGEKNKRERAKEIGSMEREKKRERGDSIGIYIH